MLDYEYILEKVDIECKHIRVNEDPQQYGWVAPANIPGIRSAQVKAVVQVMVDLLNGMERGYN